MAVNVSFMSRPLHPGQRPPVPVDRMLGGSQSRCRRCQKQKNLYPAGNRNAILKSSSPYPSHYTDWAIRKGSTYILHIKHKINLKQFPILGRNPNQGLKDSFSFIVLKCA